MPVAIDFESSNPPVFRSFIATSTLVAGEIFRDSDNHLSVSRGGFSSGEQAVADLTGDGYFPKGSGEFLQGAFVRYNITLGVIEGSNPAEGEGVVLEGALASDARVSVRIF